MARYTIVRRLRGAAGNAIVWGGCWFAATLAAVGALKVAGEPVVWGDAWRMAARVGVMGGLAGGAFSLAIGLLYRGRRLSDISWRRFGLRGGTVAAVFVPALMFVGRWVSRDGPLPMERWIASAVTAAVFGGIAAGGSLTLAQWAERRLPRAKDDDVARSRTHGVSTNG